MIKNLRIRTRILLILAAALAGLAATAGFGLAELREHMMIDRQNKVKSLVESAHSVIAHYAREEQAGRMERAEAQKAAADAVRQMRYDGNEYFFINDFDVRMIMHPIKPEMDGKDVRHLKAADGRPFVVEMVAQARQGGGFVTYDWAKPGSDKPIPKVAYVKPVTAWNWLVGTGIYVDDVQAVFLENLRSTLAMVGVIALLVGGACHLIGRGISRPLGAIGANMGALAGGSTDVAVGHADEKSEIGELARATLAFRHSLLETARLRSEQAALESNAAEERRRATRRLAAEFEQRVARIVDEVALSSGDMERTASAMTTTASDAEDKSAAVASAAVQASANVQTVASATDQLAASIGEITRHVVQATGIAQDAVENARRSQERVQSLVDAAREIGDVVRTITDIAGQTNLLALNATIEAARAGEAGKGFAVVAGEVKHLAKQTAAATDDIARRIEAIQQATAEAVGSIRDIGETIRSVDEIATTIATAVEQQGAATQEIARNVEEAASGTREVSTNVEGITDATAHTGKVAQHVLATAGRLAQQSVSLRQAVDGFLADVRAA